MRRFAKLRFERLETRFTPAVSVQFAGGHLRVFGDDQANMINVGEIGGNWGVAITTNGQTSNYGFFAVTGTLYIEARNGNDTINIGITDTFGGFSTVLAGLGDDSVNIFAAAAGANMQGLTRVDTGLGNDVTNLLGNAFRLSMTDVYVTATTGVDSLNLNNVDLQGRLVATGTDSVSIGTATAFSTVAGQVVVNNAIESNAGCFKLSNGSALGSLTFVGGSAADSVQFGAASTGTSALISGYTSLVLGAGDNTVTTAGAELDGALSVIGNTGADCVKFGANTLVAGSLNFYLGDGNNQIQANGGVTINGNFALTAGNGNDAINGGTTVPFNATLGGGFYLDLGNGDNALNFAGGLVGNLSYRGGGGKDNVTFTGAFAGSADVRLGAGNDTYSWGNSTSRFGKAFFDFGAGTDAYNVGGVVVDFPMTIVGL